MTVLQLAVIFLSLSFMAPRAKLEHKVWEYLNPAYDTYTSPVAPSEDLRIISGSNVMLSSRGYIERMPGSEKYESTATDLNDGRRTFVYRKWDGSTFVMANEVTATQSKVYKLKVGTDTTLQLIHTFTASGNTQGGNSGGVATDLVSTIAWTNINNIFASDDVKATLALAVIGDAGAFTVTGFGFQIPTVATITSIAVSHEARITANVSTDAVSQLVKNGVAITAGSLGTTGYLLSAADAVSTHSGLQATTWTPDDINNELFGCKFTISAQANGANTFELDHVYITVTYTLPLNPYDFVVANDKVFFANGGDFRFYDGTTVYPWGIRAPQRLATMTTAGTGITATSGWRYVYCYRNTTTGHRSSPSPVSASTGAVTDDTVTVTMLGTGQTGVDYIDVYRSTDGGDGIFFWIGEKANPGANTTTTYSDTTADTSLDTSADFQAPPIGYNNPPVALVGVKHYASRIWGFYNNSLYYSGWEEINTGLEEESFPSPQGLGGIVSPFGNVWQAPQEITNLAVLPDALLIVCRSIIYKVTGDSRDTFSFQPLFYGMGSAVKQSQGVAEDEGRVFWFNSDNRIWVTNGRDKSLVSEAITDDLLNISSTDFSMVVHRYGDINWLVVADNNGDTTAGAGAKWYVLDLATGKWMPPWTRSATHLFSGETAAGQFRLLYLSYDGAASGQTNLRQVSINPLTEAWTDAAGSTSTPGNYAAAASFAPITIAEHGFIAGLDNITYEKNLGSTPAADPTIDYVADETSHGNDFTLTQVNPTHRRTSLTIQEKKGNPDPTEFATGPSRSGRRMKFQFRWTAENKNFQLYSIDLAYKLVGGQD